MIDVPVALAGREYVIHVGAGLIARLGEWLAPLRPTSILVVTDSTVGALYLDQVVRALGPIARTERCVVPVSEATKDLSCLLYTSPSPRDS